VEISPGSKTDILISMKNSESKTFSIIIEVKGSWNKDLISSLKSQLVEKYMKPRGMNYGIYLVGLFKSDHWDEGSSRYQKHMTNMNKLDNLKEELKTIENHLIVKYKTLDCSLNAINHRYS
jgi:hypothetical protein